MKEVGSITLYACGGAGINVARFFEKFRKNTTESHQDDQVFARVCPVYIDTSKSNITADLPQEHIYIINNLDGSGKVRRENADVITEHTPDILQRHKPENVSIVISSASGGSGSVIAPSIVSELLNRNKTVIVLCIDSQDSVIELNNTMKTIKTYEAIAVKRDKPVVMLHLSNNDDDKGRNGVNGRMTDAITKLAALYSRNNREMDSKDLDNWIFFNKVTSFPSKLYYLDFFSGKISKSDKSHLVSVATLCTDEMNSSTGVTSEYQTVGYITEEQNKRITITSALHFAVLDGVIRQIYEELDSKVKEIQQQISARLTNKSIVSNADNATDTGLIL